MKSAVTAGLQAVVEEVNTQFKDPNLTTFVCVCIPEFLSLYETERLVQELAKFEIDTHNVVINQVIFPEHGAGPPVPCCSTVAYPHCIMKGLSFLKTSCGMVRDLCLRWFALHLIAKEINSQIGFH